MGDMKQGSKRHHDFACTYILLCTHCLTRNKHQKKKGYGIEKKSVKWHRAPFSAWEALLLLMTAPPVVEARLFIKSTTYT